MEVLDTLLVYVGLPKPHLEMHKTLSRLHLSLHLNKEG